jgi:hypothetical protein
MKRALVMKLSILGLLLPVMPVFAGTIMVPVTERYHTEGITIAEVCAF